MVTRIEAIANRAENLSMEGRHMYVQYARGAGVHQS